jgi:hypothetical protein
MLKLTKVNKDIPVSEDDEDTLFGCGEIVVTDFNIDGQGGLLMVCDGEVRFNLGSFEDLQEAVRSGWFDLEVPGVTPPESQQVAQDSSEWFAEHLAKIRDYCESHPYRGDEDWLIRVAVEASGAFDLTLRRGEFRGFLGSVGSILREFGCPDARIPAFESELKLALASGESTYQVAVDEDFYPVGRSHPEFSYPEFEEV